MKEKIVLAYSGGTRVQVWPFNGLSTKDTTL